MKTIKIITITLAIILLTLVSFGGVYIKTQNRMENKIKPYSFGRELYGERVIELKVSTSEGSKPNPEDLTIQNYEIVKNTMEARIKNLKKAYPSAFGDQDYTISLNKENGNIIVELPENEEADTYGYYLTADGKVQIKEKDSKTELLSDSMVEKALYSYNQNVDGEYEVSAQLHLTNEGQAKIEEIKKQYAVLATEIDEIEAAEEAAQKEEEKTEGKEKSTEQTTQNETDKKETKKIAVLTIGGTEYDIQNIEKTKITIQIGQKTKNSASANNNITTAAEIAMLINSGKYPITYEIENSRFLFTDITEKQMLDLAIVIAAVIAIVFIIFIAKYKINGLLASVSVLGFVSILSLLLRYTNINISIEGIGAVILILVINFRINQIILKERNNVDYKGLILKLVPVVIVTLVFSFSGWESLSSFGLVMFWGLILIASYSIIVTKTLLKLKESK